MFLTFARKHSAQVRPSLQRPNIHNFMLYAWAAYAEAGPVSGKWQRNSSRFHLLRR